MDSKQYKEAAAERKLLRQSSLISFGGGAMREAIDYDRIEFEKCARGEMYNTAFRGRDELVTQALALCQEYNQTPAGDKKRREALIRELFGKVGKNPDIEPNVFCGFGFNIEVGDNFFANNGCNFMDPAKITFGDNVFIGPDCGFYTAHHPIGYKLRNRLYEWAFPITVGDNVWFGGGCRILPGVTIGSNVVIGAGSVVTRDIPDNCIAAGNPCRILRYIDEDGRKVKKEDGKEQAMEYGKKTWIFADGDLPPLGDSEPYGHEALSIVNCGGEDAEIQVKVLFSDREPDRFVLRVPADRVICFRLDGPVGESEYQIPFGQYALLLESNVPIVAVLGRLDRRENVSYYELDGYSC